MFNKAIIIEKHLWILIFLYLMLFIDNSTSLPRTEQTPDISLLIGQCKANCLRYFSQPNEEEIPDLIEYRYSRKSDLITMFYENLSDSVSQCYETCDQQTLDLQNLPKCLSYEKQKINYACIMGQVFFQRSLAKETKSCPNQSLSSRKIDEQVLNCKDTCIADDECESPLEKCCKNGCKSMCMLAINRSGNSSDVYIPGVPESPQFLIEGDRMQINVINANPTFSTDVFYVIQARVCVCSIFDKEHVGNWKHIHMMTNRTVDLDHLPRGQIVQFRIAAVNSNGTLGYSQPSKPHIPLAPNRPGMPRNVTEVQWKFESNFKVEILLKWQAPIEGDLPIKEYNITWIREEDDMNHINEQSNGKSLTSSTIYQKTIPGMKNECILDNLHPGSRYRVQLVSISYWPGYGVLKSEPFVYYIKSNDPYASNVKNYRQKLNQEVNRDPCKCNENDGGLMEATNNMNRKSISFHINRPEYERNKLSAQVTIIDYERLPTRYLVEWSPRVCIESEENQNLLYQHQDSPQASMKKEVLMKSFKLTNLKFHCKYLVNITKIDALKKTRLPQSTKCFCTKSCGETYVVHGGPQPICSSNLQTPPPRPKSIREELLNNTNGHYIISWKIDPYSMTQNDPQANNNNPSNYQYEKISSNRIKFRVTWGPRVYEPIDERMYNSGFNFVPLLDEKLSQVKVINMENDNKILLQSLTPDTVYLVKIQTLVSSPSGEELESPVEVIYFKTKGKQISSKSDYPNFHAYSSGRSNYQQGDSLLINCIAVLLLLKMMILAI